MLVIVLVSQKAQGVLRFDRDWCCMCCWASILVSQFWYLAGLTFCLSVVFVIDEEGEGRRSRRRRSKRICRLYSVSQA